MKDAIRFVVSSVSDNSDGSVTASLREDIPAGGAFTTLRFETKESNGFLDLMRYSGRETPRLGQGFLLVEEDKRFAVTDLFATAEAK